MREFKKKEKKVLYLRKLGVHTCPSIMTFSIKFFWVKKGNLLSVTNGHLSIVKREIIHHYIEGKKKQQVKVFFFSLYRTCRIFFWNTIIQTSQWIRERDREAEQKKSIARYTPILKEREIVWQLVYDIVYILLENQKDYNFLMKKCHREIHHLNWHNI